MVLVHAFVRLASDYIGNTTFYIGKHIFLPLRLVYVVLILMLTLLIRYFNIKLEGRDRNYWEF